MRRKIIEEREDNGRKEAEKGEIKNRKRGKEAQKKKGIREMRQTMDGNE